MNKIIRVVGFLVLFCSIFMILEKTFFNRNEVNSVWGKLENTEIDILLMGNSHLYTSLDAKVLSDATGLEIDCLGSGSQYMEQTLENLKVVLKYQKPKFIILETNCFYGDSRDKMWGESFGLMLQNTDGVNNFWYKVQSVLKTYKMQDIGTALFQLVRPTETWSRFEDFSKRKEYIEDMNGYRGAKSKALVYQKMDEVQSEYLERYQRGEKLSLTDYNEQALREFLELTNKNDIEVWMYKGPTTRASYAKHALIAEDICREYDNVIYIDDMHAVLTEIGLDENDWYDSGHLNRAGGEKVTRFYGTLLAERLGVDLSWNDVFAYSGEAVTALGYGNYLYEMNNYSNNCLYQFKLYVDGELLDVQDYSKNNTYECEYDAQSSDSVKVYCAMIPVEDAALRDKSVNRIYVSFMKQNDCIIE